MSPSLVGASRSTTLIFTSSSFDVASFSLTSTWCSHAFQASSNFAGLSPISRLQHSLQHCESSTRSLRCVFRHKLSPDFEPVPVRNSLYQSQASSCGQCRQPGVQCVWLNVRMNTEPSSVPARTVATSSDSAFCRSCTYLVHKSEGVLELETELQPGPLIVVIRSRSCSKFQDFRHVRRL